MDLAKEREEYYRYPQSGFEYKKPPALDADLANWLKTSGMGKFYRFVWCGVALTRDSERSSVTVLRGDKLGTKPGYLQFDGGKTLVQLTVPKRLYVRCRQTRGYTYTDNDGHKVFTTNQSLIPKNALYSFEYNYVDYGRLNWDLEYRNPADASEDLDRWSWIMTLKTERQTYYHPGMEMRQIIEMREDQNRNADLTKVAQLEMERTAKRELEREKEDDQEIMDFSNLITREAEAFAARNPHTVS